MLLNVAAVAGLICIVLVVLSVVFHISLIMFKTGSMTPTIPQGSVAVVREVPASHIAVGDIVTVDRDGQLPITHRVTSVEGSGSARTITMKGDANDYPDPAPYTVTHVRTVLWSIPALANVIVWMSNPLVLGGLTIGASVLVTWAFWPRGEAKPRRSTRSRSGRHAHMTAIAVTVLVGGLGLAVGPTSAAHADQKRVTHGEYITLTTIGDDEAMTSLSPGVPVTWQIGVDVNAPSAGDAIIDLTTHGDLNLDVSIRACTFQWVESTCPGNEVSVADVGEFTGDQTGVELLAMPTSEQRWLLFTVTLPADAHGTMTADVRVKANGETVSDSTEASTLPRTGTNIWLAIGLAIGAILIGLLIAGIAAQGRRSS
ncbi:signal peptidase I [Microbacterium sp. MPKO10]|uniref:signal peptidase I n=1 Tax=Microbacterium sp. MPKO10 TaxID=2989818 RepID=UPI00223676A8|nr:signal peptidase I [Microbacterium sp. MPKO10]MCW4458677.1 signal peptidase I [Microbacterium sp. MPKO10]